MITCKWNGAALVLLLAMCLLTASAAAQAITDLVIIDGYTQPGASPNTNGSGLGLNTVLKIELDGSNAWPPGLREAVTASLGETDNLLPSDGAEGDAFGISVSLSGDRALIGAVQDDDIGSDSGSAYVFDLNGGTWTETQKLTASDGAAGDNFGVSVSLSGDRALIGAPGDDGLRGSAYVFDLNGGTWTETQKLTASDGAADAFFGFSVSLSGDRALIGAPFDDDNGSDSGSAYVFDEPATGTIAEAEAEVPTAYALRQNYPNPFNPETTIRFGLPEAVHVQLLVYDVMGREVARLVDQPLHAGTHAVTWDASGLPSGAYLYRLAAGAFTETKAMTLLK